MTVQFHPDPLLASRRGATRNRLCLIPTSYGQRGLVDYWPVNYPLESGLAAFFEGF